MKGFFVNLLLSFFATLIVLTILELSAQKINTTILKDKINSADLRTKFEQAYIPPFPPKDPEVFTVFVYGGSTIQGLPLPKVGVVSQLDYQLHQVLGEKKAVQVYNLGWSGYNSTMARYLLTQTAKYKPDLAIVYTGENEFIYPQLDAYPLLRIMTALKNRSNLVKIILTLKQTTPVKTQSLDEKVDKKRPAFRENKWFYALKMFVFKKNVQAMVQTTKQANIPLVLCTTVSNIVDWPPVSRNVTTTSQSENLARDFEKISRLVTEKSIQKAEKQVDVSLRSYPHDASLLYLKAQIASASGQPQAAQLFIQAKDFDLIPWRASSEQNDFIRSLDDQKTVWVADLEKAFFANSPAHHLTGFPFIIDNVHPTKEGAYLMAQTIINLLKTEKIAKKDWWEETKPFLAQDEFLERVKFSPGDEFGIYFSTAKYCMKNPFFQFGIAETYLDRAQGFEQKDWRVPALRASIAFLQNQKDLAQGFLQEAKEATDAALTQEQIQEIPYLNQFLEAK